MMTVWRGITFVRLVSSDSATPDQLADTVALVISILILAGVGLISRFVIRARQTEQAPRETETDLAAAQRITHLGSWTWDVASDELTWSDETYRIFGLTPGGLSSREAFEAGTHPEDREAVRSALQKTIDGGGPCSIDHRVIRPDASIRWVSENAALIAASNGRPPRLVGTTRDITDAVAAWQALAEAEARRNTELRASETAIRSIIETAPDPIFIADSGGRILQANAAASAVFGWPADEIVGRNIADLTGGGSACEHREYMRHYAETGLASTDEGLVLGRTRREGIGRRRDGEEFPVELSVAALDDGSGERRFVGIVRDISQRKHDEAELGRLNDDLAERAQERKRLIQQILGAYAEERQRIAYDIHDGPTQHLVGAFMYLESFRSGRDHREDDEQERYLELAGTQLDAALSETRRIMADLRPALLDDLGLPEALRISLAEMVEPKEVELDYTANSDAPRPDITIEIALLHIAQEAVSNALKHAHTPRVAVSLYITATNASLSVRDWGEGFDTTRAAGALPGGLRLGLAGMRERTRLLGGTLTIDSVIGKGTTVTVNVPARLAAELATPAAQSKPAAQTMEPHGA